MVLLVALAILVPVIAYDNGGAGAFPMRGWSTWCTDDYCGLLDYCFEEEVQQIADALVSTGMRELNYTTLLLDDCWSARDRDSNGNLQMDAGRFPSGIDSLVSYVHARGLRLGLYTCAGERTCKFNRTGSGGHYEQDANWFAAHHVDLVKIDNCGHPDTPPPVYMGNFSAYLNATGVPIELALCEWGEDAPWTGWGAAIAQSYRTTHDHLPFWSFNYQGVGQGVIEIINAMALVNNASVPFGYGDPDFLELGLPTLSEADGQTEFTFWAIFGGPMLISTDIRNMSDWKKSVVLNAEILAVNYDPLRSPGRRVAFSNTTKTQAWAKTLAAPGQQAVALLNYADLSSQPVAVSWVELGWPATATVALYDLWAHAPIGNFSAGHSVTLPPHGSAMWRATLL